MNCKNVEPLLALYAGRDLDEEHSQLVASHLQSCTQCSLAADEYAWASQLLQRCEPPRFSDEIYSGIREEVLNKIERKNTPVSPGVFAQLFAVLAQPRMRWITAALLLAISVTALYLSRKPSRQLSNDRRFVVLTGDPNQADVRSETRNESTVSSSVSNEGKVRTTHRRIIRRRDANAGVVATNLARKLDTTTKIDAQPPSSAPAPMRVEIQTSDRNIRIIWLSGQRALAGGSDGSKGL
jgi:putative zinc finger protein